MTRWSAATLMGIVYLFALATTCCRFPYLQADWICTCEASCLPLYSQLSDKVLASATCQVEQGAQGQPSIGSILPASRGHIT